MKLNELHEPPLSRVVEGGYTSNCGFQRSAGNMLGRSDCEQGGGHDGGGLVQR